MRRFLPCAALLLAVLSDGALAQTPRPVTPREAVRRGFDRAAPQLGKPLPAVQGHLSDGSQFPLSNLKGQYSVVVFGCLT